MKRYILFFTTLTLIASGSLSAFSSTEGADPWMLLGKWSDISLRGVVEHPVKDSSWEEVSLVISSIENDQWYSVSKLDGVVTLGCKLPVDPMDFFPECYTANFTGQYYKEESELSLTPEKNLPYFGNILYGSLDAKNMILTLKSRNSIMDTYKFNFTPKVSTRVVAHRGDSDHFPENTLLAIKKASEDGADIIEFDIHLSRDGIPVVIHDATVERTTNGFGAVKAMTVEELKKLSAGYSKKFGEGFKDEKIPTLREIFENIPKEQLLFVEIKTEAVTDNYKDSAEFKALELAREFDRLPSTIFISFNELAVQRLVTVKKESGERIKTGLIASPQSLPNVDPVERAKNLGADWGIFSKYYVQGNKKSKPPIIPNPNFGKNKGDLKLAIWTFGSPNVKEALQYLPAGYDAVATNSPKETKELLNRFKEK